MQKLTGAIIFTISLLIDHKGSIIFSNPRLLYLSAPGIAVVAMKNNGDVKQTFEWIFKLDKDRER